MTKVPIRIDGVYLLGKRFVQVVSISGSMAHVKRLDGGGEYNVSLRRLRPVAEIKKRKDGGI